MNWLLVIAPFPCASPDGPSRPSAPPSAAPRSGSVSGWRRYLEAGPDGLDGLTWANHHIAVRLSPELERTIFTIRRRLRAHATPAARYSLIGPPPSAPS
jgi:hypothetical protein